MVVRFACLAIPCLLSCSSVWAQPALTHAIPGAVRPGQTTELTLYGAKLDGDLRLWSSFPATLEWQPVDAGKKDLTSRICKVTVGADVAVGIGGIVVGSAAGNSDVIFLMVDDMPSVPDAGDNQSLDKAQAITLPVGVDGVSNGAAFDYYQFAAKKDQRVSVEVVGTRIAQNFDAVVRLLDGKGKELWLADDDASFGADCRFAYTIPADGDYVLEVRDNQFRAGGRYRLRVGDFPLVSAAYPLGGRFGSTMRFQFTGPFVESALPVFLRLPEDLPSGQLRIAAKFPTGNSSGMATIAASRLPGLVESEPNNDGASATLTSIPCALYGAFERPGDRDYFQFAATKGQALHFRAVSRSLGSPAYLQMRLLNAEGGQLAESPINDSDEASLTYTFPADGMYRLLVEELLNRGGPEFGYSVEIESQGGFTLTLKHDKNTRTRFVLPRNGGACSVTLQVARRGYEGPIQLALVDAPAGYQLLQSIIPEKAKEHTVLLSVPAEVVPGELVVFRIAGTAAVDGRESRVLAESAPTLKANLPQVAFPPSWLNGLFIASVAAESPPAFELTTSASPAVFSRAQGQVQFTVKLERKIADFKDAVALNVDGLPSQFQASVKADKDTYEVTIKGPKDAANGRVPCRLWGYGELKGTGRVVSVSVPLEVTD